MYIYLTASGNHDKCSYSFSERTETKLQLLSSGIPRLLVS